MSHVTLEQALTLKRLGYPLCDKPSAEELMEWLASEYKDVSEQEKSNLIVTFCRGQWCVYFEGEDLVPFDDTSPRFWDKELINALFQAACWVLEGKK